MSEGKTNARHGWTAYFVAGEVRSAELLDKTGTCLVRVRIWEFFGIAKN